MMAKQPLKYGEKVLFSIFGAFLLVALASVIALEAFRAQSPKPVFQNLTHYNLSPLGEKGSVIYRKSGCNSCHRAMREGTNMGLDLDGIGSRRSLAWIESFLANPEKTYKAVTFDHGEAPKEAAYVAQMPETDRHAMAVFLSELTADRGSAEAPEPPKGDSSFINSMLKNFAPKSWQSEYSDVRSKDDKGGQQQSTAPQGQ
jgi:hypothetical protein